MGAPLDQERELLRFHVHRTVMVTVVPVGMMQMTVHEVVDVVPVRHRFMTTPWAVHMIPIVTTAAMVGRAVGRIDRVDVDAMLIEVVPVRVVQVTLLEKVDVVPVLDPLVPTAGPVMVFVLPVRIVGHGLESSPPKGSVKRTRPPL